MDTQALEARLREANKLEALARFARGVAHDCNNVLTAVTANCDLLLEDIEPDDPRRPEVVAIREAIERATEMTRRLFKLGAVQPLESELVDLNDLVRTTEQELSALAGDRMAVATAVGPFFSPCTDDPRELKQALPNLVLNARDAMPDSDKITIETANVVLDETYAADHRLMPQGHYALLAVTDTGTGMDAEARAHLFEPYFTTRDRSSRSGLGLATVYGVVKRSGGFVWVDSEPGLGTSVKIYLPLPRAPGPAPVLPTPAPIVSLRGTETILLVEDEDAVRTVARQVLQRHGYAVIEVARPEDALALADTSQAVDLLLTDIVMPGLVGRTLAAQITAQRLGTLELVMSGYPAAAIGRHQMLERGLAFLQKPFSAAALAQKVREVLG